MTWNEFPVSSFKFRVGRALYQGTSEKWGCMRFVSGHDFSRADKRFILLFRAGFSPLRSRIPTIRNSALETGKHSQPGVPNFRLAGGITFAKLPTGQADRLERATTSPMQSLTFVSQVTEGTDTASARQARNTPSPPPNTPGPSPPGPAHLTLIGIVVQCRAAKRTWEHPAGHTNPKPR